jgi:protocatechuate 3,4-dioxygenase, alpha subunit
MKLLATSSQTVGPYLHIGLAWLTIDHLASADAPGERVTIGGQVLDGDGQPVTDALIEIWQANPAGQYGRPEFRGFGRVPTNAEGRFEFETVKPGAVADPEGAQQAPHLLVSIFMRGLLKRLVTRIYFPDEPRNADDFVLRQVPVERQSTLVARQAGTGKLGWNVLLQGADETVFFDC